RLSSTGDHNYFPRLWPGERRDRLVRLGEGGLEQLLIVIHHTLDGRPVEKVGIVAHLPDHPIPQRREAERHVELRRVEPDRYGRTLQTGQRNRPLLASLVAEHDL